MRLLTKFDIRNNNVVKGINYEGVEVVGNYLKIYNNVCLYIKNNISINFEIILNDITASLFSLKSGEKNIIDIFNNKLYALPHIYSGGISCITDFENCLTNGGDRVMMNTILFEDLIFLKNIIQIYGSQIIIASIETRFINDDYYVYKSYGRDFTGIKLLDWIKTLYDNGIIEILIISIDKDGSLEGHDKMLLQYISNSKIFEDKHLSILYAGGIKDFNEIEEIKKNFSFITGISISTLFYKNISILG